jgi:uncharacterized membrane protein (UPF0127 family)
MGKNKIIYSLLLIAVGCVVAYAWFVFLYTPVDTNVVFRKIQISGAEFNVEIAASNEEKLLGLSGRSSLASSTGMFFIFNYPGNWGIWMKDMNFPIDVLWIDDDFKINHIVEDMAPQSYPQVYKPTSSARYVLELPAGTVKDRGIKIGQSIFLE